MKKQVQVKKWLKTHVTRDYILAYLASMVLAGVWYLRINHIIREIFHYQGAWQKIQLLLYCGVGFLVLSTLIFSVYYFIKNYHKHRAFLKYFLAYFAIMMIFLLLAWPGIFKGDEFYTIPTVTNMQISWGQHYFTNLFYAISLAIIPTLGGITFFQLLIISIVVAYILAGIENLQLIKHRRLIYLLFIPLLLPPVIDNNLFTLRSSINAFLFLLVIFQLIFYAKDRRPGRLIYLGFLSCIIGVWKSEFIYVPVLVALFLLIFYRKQLHLKKFFIGLATFAVFFYLIRLPQSLNTKNYYITLVANPLSVMARAEGIEYALSDEDRQAIENLISFDDLRQYSSIYNVDALFHFHPGFTPEDSNKLIKSYLKLVLAKPRTFFNARWLTYAATNFPTAEDRPNHTGAESVSSQWTLIFPNSYGDYFKTNFRYTDNLFGEDFKKWFVTTLLQRNYEDYTPTSLNNIIYNVTLPVIISTVLLLVFLLRKKWQAASLLFIELAQLPVIFVSAPATFWMYYVGLYILLYFTIFYYTIVFIDSRLKTQKRH